ncbi:MAG TPA: response regulator [Verrucomicrobiae bacterium]|nr:response regulator [Verrucomicrobiae bacterium]
MPFSIGQTSVGCVVSQNASLLAVKESFVYETKLRDQQVVRESGSAGEIGTVDEKVILLAEDFDDDAKIIQVVLSQAGVENPVFVVSDGREVIAYLRGEGKYANRKKFPVPSVLLLDLKMPKCDGFDVLEWCKKQPQLGDMLVVVLTGNRELSSVKRAYELGAHSFLVKPCQTQDIVHLTQSFRGYWNFSPVS